MILVRVLQRRDAASVVVAIAAGLVLAQFLGTISYTIATSLIVSWLTPGTVPAVIGWQQAYLVPFITMLVSFVGLEVLATTVVFVRQQLVRKSPAKISRKK